MSTTGRIFERQGWHVASLVALLAGVYGATRLDPGLLDGEGLGLSASGWFLIALAVPIVHQTYVWLCWRTQLHLSLLTRVLGDGAFSWYARGFSLLFSSRFVVLIALGWATRDTLPLAMEVRIPLAIVVALPAVYTIYSVERYFGGKRAAGLDHFDPKYRDMPFVDKGMFRWVDNAMYACGFLMFWALALALGSTAALVVAAYAHGYIWVHYFCTEVPDMRVIYGPQGDVSERAASEEAA